MTVCSEKGKDVYIFKKRLITKIIFWLLMSFCFVSLTVFFILFLTGRKSGAEFAKYSIFTAVAVFFLALIPVLLERICKLYIPNFLNIALYLIPVLNPVVGEALGVYNMGFGFDKIMHAFNGIVFIFLGISIVLMMNKMPRENKSVSVFFILFFAFCFSMFIEYFWEIYEYITDTVQPGLNMQRWRDGLIAVTENGFLHSNFRGSAIADTLYDMIFHAITSFVTCVACYIYMRKNKLAVYQMSVLNKKTTDYFKALSGTGLETGISPEEIIDNSAKIC